MKQLPRWTAQLVADFNCEWSYNRVSIKCKSCEDFNRVTGTYVTPKIIKLFQDHVETHKIPLEEEIVEEFYEIS